MSTHHISVTINGTAYEGDVEARILLVHWIRDTLLLTGTHIGCDTTSCGACTILVDGKATKSCTMFAVQANGRQIMTVEGLEQSDKLHGERADNLSSRTILEGQVRELTELLEEKTATLEREHQLMAVSKDVRQLMGARNLHIVDVHDVNGSGNADRAFGRVFYAEGQSLIFYAFDLPSGRLGPAKYTFQAWGHREAESQSARNLGTFEVDDHDQRRWVLKITDTTLLSGIDSVFVTAESLNYAKTPRGKKLLYAYIFGQPHHP